MRPFSLSQSQELGEVRLPITTIVHHNNSVLMDYQASTF
nr:MAG TPA: hypothetical protein [Siphoviridae sp. ctRJB2]